MLKKVLDLATCNSFLRKTVVPKYDIDQYKIGPVGQLLCQNLYTEWFYNIVINKDLTVVLNDGNLSDTFDYAKNLCCEKLPFGIADSQKIKKSFSTEDTVEYYKNAGTGKNVSFEDLLRHEDDVVLKFYMFVTPSESTRLFHQWQRHRRIWYRKFSAYPERYRITDIKNNEEMIQSVDIEAKYPWGSQILETLILNTDDKNFTSDQLQFKERKFVYAHAITSQVNLPTLFLNSIFDSYEEPFFKEKARPLLRFHRKLAPYKLSCAITGSTQAVLSELNDLALYLSKQLRTNHISTLLLPSSSICTLEAQFRQYDQLGIPYTIVLNERTLKDGIANIRSRDTTLKEQVHVTELVGYVEKLFKNY